MPFQPPDPEPAAGTTQRQTQHVSSGKQTQTLELKAKPPLNTRKPSSASVFTSPNTSVMLADATSIFRLKQRSVYHTRSGPSSPPRGAWTLAIKNLGAGHTGLSYHKPIRATAFQTSRTQPHKDTIRCIS